MTAITVTAASVTLKNDKTVTNGVSGEALTQGEVCFKDTDNKWYAASAISDGDLSSKDVGIALCPADALDERAIIAKENQSQIDLGGTPTAGSWYVVGGADGVIEEFSDLSAGEAVTFVGNGDGTYLWFQKISQGDTK